MGRDDVEVVLSVEGSALEPLTARVVPPGILVDGGVPRPGGGPVCDPRVGVCAAARPTVAAARLLALADTCEALGAASGADQLRDAAERIRRPVAGSEV